MTKEKPIFAVYTRKGGKLLSTHSTYEKAISEAIRLAKENKINPYVREVKE